ncbi:hypothetical protein IF1G_02561 [Cordyceps javanica]|uniref:Uncharacterized protein n=1 Tax=Cordyceps javanica TaxID=43265 RepID=A0A545V9S8_9HYPO|nr:hypothetical protein IF1G_02561 [Cordyceps javanica]TQW09699.1 hypothetical protein IF2G_02489 [Cordyceps javanica]
MCRPVYFACPYCDARRFFMWEECSRFWARYQYIVIDQGNFELRPRFSRRADEPPLCGGTVQPPKNREFMLGRCPRIQLCPSLQPFLQQRPQQQWTWWGGNGRMPAHGHGLAAGWGETPEERRRREFAERFFRKLPVQRLQRFDAPQLGDDNAADDEKLRGEEYTIDHAGEEPPELSGQTIASVPEPPEPLEVRRPISGQELSQSLDSTFIESGSEVDSFDWNLQCKSLRALNVDAAHSI